MHDHHYHQDEMSGRTVLISSSGRRVELWELFESAIRELGLDWAVIGADATSSCATSLRTGRVMVVPRIGTPEFPHAIHDLVSHYSVALIVPTIDTELPLFATFQHEGVLVAGSSLPTVDICRDKLATFEWAMECGIPVPETIPLVDVDPTRYTEWVVKPVSGSSSVGVRLRLSPGEVATLAKRCTEADGRNLIAQPFLTGPEFTVNCFMTRSGQCAYSIPHLRIATRSGEVSHALTVHDREIEGLAERVVTALPNAFGPVCVQFIRDRDRGLVMIEVNARFGGGYPVAHQAGARGPHRLLAEAAGLPMLAPFDSWQAGVEMLRFDQSVFTTRRADPQPGQSVTG